MEKLSVPYLPEKKRKNSFFTFFLISKKKIMQGKNQFKNIIDIYIFLKSVIELLLEIHCKLIECKFTSRNLNDFNITYISFLTPSFTPPNLIPVNLRKFMHLNSKK